MARRSDTGWRDSLLAARHARWGFHAPAAGMTLPMIEYDRGRAVGVIDYRPVGQPLPNGPEVGAAFEAFGSLWDRDGLDPLPFITARYDSRDWSFDVFPHNAAARSLIGHQDATRWTRLSEREYAALLYRMRDYNLPDLSGYGVVWNETYRVDAAGFIEAGESWPGQSLSYRRRAWEPAVSVPFRQRIPCLDVDFALVDHERRLAAVVDYKALGPELRDKPFGGGLPMNLAHPNFLALASLTTHYAGVLTKVPAFLVQYAPGRAAWELRVHCLNHAANLAIACALGATDAYLSSLTEAMSGAEWIRLTEVEWVNVLRYLRDN